MTHPDQGAKEPDRLSRAFHWIASIALVAIMLVVVADVFLRFVFNTPVRGAYDMVSIGLLVMVFFGIGPVIANRGEILIDLLDDLLPRRALRILQFLAAIGTVAVFLFIGWSMLAPAQDAYRYGDRSLELGLPVWINWLLGFLGLAGILWAAIRAALAVPRGDSDDTGDPGPAAGEGGAS